METFRAVHLSIGQADETCLQDVLEEILLRINLPDKKFQESLNFHFEDEEKKTQIRLAMSEAAIDNGEGLAKNEPFKPKEITMTKKEAIALQQKVQALSIDQIKQLKAMSPSEIQVEIQYLQPKLQDLFH